MKIIILGNILFTEKIINYLIKKKIIIVGIVSQNNRKIKDDFTDLSKIAKKNRLPYLETSNINSKKSINWIKKKNCNLIISIGWSQIIKHNFFKLVKKKIIGYHPSELPKNRGRHPIIWSLVLNLKKTASTFFHMSEKIDVGQIIDQKIITIPKHYTSQNLYNALCKIAQKQLLNIIKFKKFNKKIKIKNKDKTSNYWRARDKNDGLIDWRMNSENIYNLIRALNKPYSGATFNYKNNEYSVFESKIINKNLKNIEPGKVLKRYDNNAYLIKTGNKALKISQIVPKIKLKKNLYL